jgi:DNA-binding GntR family transcriptional regulator
MLVSDAPGGALRIRIEHHDAVAHLMGSNDEEAAELAAAQHAQRGRGQNHGNTKGGK